MRKTEAFPARAYCLSPLVYRLLPHLCVFSRLGWRDGERESPQSSEELCVGAEENYRGKSQGDEDVFDRSVAFWQLHLYFSRNGHPDLYSDVMEQMRLRPDAGSGNDVIRNQFEFVKICCDVSKLDLTEFFERWGFFWVGQLTVEDYGKYDYNITQSMVDETKSYIAKRKYKKPSAHPTAIEG